ncbi:hypothetical protein DFJ58DRAFT_842651 [Suillus subalutaceus]|uniref:uncharacterized protein n=1 Tax=Suillus subalutaceus TaxID=48586 RepID=UPI001B87AD96|nr:uncharacterized protein DFJ58DRAFT_842651 [Suillus subalutaceus]KAG1849444.1 hypothetical protein DFJ58DRAFT_842651 [Suillus subalutaceus]
MSEMLQTVFVVASPYATDSGYHEGGWTDNSRLMGEACTACQQRCSYVKKQAQVPLSSDKSESDSGDKSDSDAASESESESQSFDSSDKVTALDEKPSDWVDKPLDKKKQVRLEAKLLGVKQCLAQMEEMHREIEKVCRVLEQVLNSLDRCLAG